MGGEVGERLHILSLVVKRPQDIPKIRGRAKLLARAAGYARIAVIQIAAAASEMARLLLQRCSGGTVHLAMVRAEGPHSGTGIELVFEGRRPYSHSDCGLTEPKGEADFPEQLMASHPMPGLRKVLDGVWFEGGAPGTAFRVRCRKLGLAIPWDELREREAGIKRELFADTEESYVENLRAKHEEVLRLLREKSEQNRQLDRMNAQLLQLTQDLEALAQERTVAEMALCIADQIRNPATAIGGLARVLERDAPEGAADLMKLQAISQQAQKLENTVRNFERLVREQGRFFVQEDLRAVVEEALKAWRITVAKKEFAVEVQLPPEPVPVKANRRTLKVALLHVLRNAAHASAPGGRIAVGLVRADDGHPEVRISDEGPGIPSEVREKLFRTSVTTKPTGTGLGLLLVEQILREHQGRVCIDSSPEKGTTVALCFPVRWREFTPEPVLENGVSGGPSPG